MLRRREASFDYTWSERFTANGEQNSAVRSRCIAAIRIEVLLRCDSKWPIVGAAAMQW